ncbi:hypothetical protein L204_103154 [Cryptococcus depauperatus]|nr:hypothetical protein L204_00100 [Cryptococcus depauperatus CBS 7855]
MTTQKKWQSTTTLLPKHSQLRLLTTYITHEPDGPKYTEYRVYNYRHLASGNIKRGDGWGLVELLVAAVLLGLAYKWKVWDVLREMTRGQVCFLDVGHIKLVVYNALLLWSLWIRCNTVLYESVIPIPNMGIQLSTTRGIPIPFTNHTAKHSCTGVPLSTSRVFIPFSEISTIILHQGLTRFRVQYYLAIVRKRGERISVALDEIRPPFDVLHEIYLGAREVLCEEHEDTSYD